MKTLVFIDCVRYRYHNLFQVDGFQELHNVISVSNWTVPVMSTVMTGLHPVEHKVCIFPHRGNRVQFLRGLKDDQYRWNTKPSLLDKYNYKAVVELPVFSVVFPYKNHESGLARNWFGVKKTREILQKGKPEFLFIHFKGGHDPYTYTGKTSGEKKHTQENEAADIEKLARKSRALLEDLRDMSDRMVIIADHGELWTGPGKGHGERFALENLHVPCFTYPNEGLKDELYDSRIAYDFLEEKPIHSRQLVFSTTPAYEDYNKLAVSYQSNGELETEVFQTKKGWDL